MRLYVGSLSFEATEDDVRKLFEPFGEVRTVEFIRAEGIATRHRGFCFVEMPDNVGAAKAIQALDASIFQDRVLRISPAIPRRERSNSERRQMPHWGR